MPVLVTILRLKVTFVLQSPIRIKGRKLVLGFWRKFQKRLGSEEGIGSRQNEIAKAASICGWW